MMELWNWAGWDRVADLATICTAFASLTIAVQIATRDRAGRKALEKYLKKVGRDKRDDQQGLRSALHLSKELGIPEDDVQRIALRSGQIVAKMRDRQGEERHLRFGYKGLAG